MTRRQRMERIIESFGEDSARRHLADLLARSDSRSLLTDAAIDQLAGSLVRGRQQQARYNAHNRRIGRA